MRMTVYNPESSWYKVEFNGEIVSGVLAADEEEGWIVFNVYQDAEGNIYDKGKFPLPVQHVPDPFEDPPWARRICFGKVVIRRKEFRLVTVPKGMPN